MREKYEYAVVDVASFFKFEEKETTAVSNRFRVLDRERLEGALNELGEDGFRVVTEIETPEGKLIIMSKAIPKNHDRR